MTFQLDLISKYRSYLMGIAALSIIFLHIPVSFDIEILDKVKNFGYFGVEIFFFVSGMGMYFSWQKSPNTIEFYKKRLIRIIPPYFFVIILFALSKSIFTTENFLDYLYLASTLQFWKNESLYFWFVPAIIFCYLITPIFFSVFKKHIYSGVILISISLIAISYFAQATPYFHYIFTPIRLINYFFGILLGHIILTQRIKEIKTFPLICIYIIGLISIYYCFYFLDKYFLLGIMIVWIPHIALTLPLCILFCQLISLYKNYHFPILTFLGKHSLTIYLLQDPIYGFTRTLSDSSNIFIFSIVSTVFIFILALFIDRLTSKLTKKRMYN